MLRLAALSPQSCVKINYTRQRFGVTVFIPGITFMYNFYTCKLVTSPREAIEIRIRR